MERKGGRKKRRELEKRKRDRLSTFHAYMTKAGIQGKEGWYGKKEWTWEMGWRAAIEKKKDPSRSEISFVGTVDEDCLDIIGTVIEKSMVHCKLLVDGCAEGRSEEGNFEF